MRALSLALLLTVVACNKETPPPPTPTASAEQGKLGAVRTPAPSPLPTEEAPPAKPAPEVDPPTPGHGLGTLVLLMDRDLQRLNDRDNSPNFRINGEINGRDMEIFDHLDGFSPIINTDVLAFGKNARILVPGDWRRAALRGKRVRLQGTIAKKTTSPVTELVTEAVRFTTLDVLTVDTGSERFVVVGNLNQKNVHPVGDKVEVLGLLANPIRLEDGEWAPLIVGWVVIAPGSYEKVAALHKR